MARKLDGLKLPCREFEGVPTYLLAIPHPPQLRQAIAYEDTAEYVGIWFDKGKVSINDSYSNFTSSNPGWEAYWNYPLVANYLYALRSFGSAEIDFFGKIENHGVAEHGFLLAEGQIFLATVRDITKIIDSNIDKRSDWIRNATEQDLLNPQWQERYRAYSSSRFFPKHNLDCLQATRQMLTWLDSNF